MVAGIESRHKSMEHRSEIQIMKNVQNTVNRSPRWGPGSTFFSTFSIKTRAKITPTVPLRGTGDADKKDLQPHPSGVRAMHRRNIDEPTMDYKSMHFWDSVHRSKGMAHRANRWTVSSHNQKMTREWRRVALRHQGCLKWPAHLN